MFKIIFTWTDYTTGNTQEDGIWHRRYKTRKTAEKVACSFGYKIKGAYGGECIAMVVEVNNG